MVILLRHRATVGAVEFCGGAQASFADRFGNGICSVRSAAVPVALAVTVAAEVTPPQRESATLQAIGLLDRHGCSGYRSERNSWRGVPVMRSTSSARFAGIPLESHLWTA